MTLSEGLWDGGERQPLPRFNKTFAAFFVARLCWRWRAGATDNIEMALSDVFEQAHAAHQAGNLDQAAQGYQAVLREDTRHSDAMHLLGVLAFQVGRFSEAARIIRLAIEIKPAAPYLGNLGLALAKLGQWEQAVEAYRQALRLRPDLAEAHNNLGIALVQMGRLDDAIAAYQRAIAHRPDFSAALNNLGLALFEAGHASEAADAYRHAIRFAPRDAEARNNLGNALLSLGQTTQAVDCFREALSLQPALAEACNNLGNALRRLGRAEEAAAAFERALALRPAFPEALNNLGALHCDKGETAKGQRLYRRAIELQPSYAQAIYNLAVAVHAEGDVRAAIDLGKRAMSLEPNWATACGAVGQWLAEIGHNDEALTLLERAIAIDPASAEAHGKRANVLRQIGRVGDAVAAYRKALSLQPRNASVFNNLGSALRQGGRLGEAIEAFEQASALEPALPEPHNNLGNTRKDQGDVAGAIESYSRAVELRPHDAAADSNRCYTMYYHPAYTPQTILSEHRRWNERHARHLRPATVDFSNAPFPRRTLRIGYVSPDFREHCQALFTLPLLANHDRDRFEIFCYSDAAAPDATTDELRSLGHAWRNIAGLGDERVAAMIREDRIDILIDLTVHMANHRLLVFARKAAPVQATWLGYPGTTGLETMDYRLSDRFLDPPGEELNYVEKTLRLRDSFWCYDPRNTALEVNPLPAGKRGFVTFGCLNNFCKVNDGTLAIWAKIMGALPTSRLLLLAPEGTARLRVLEALAATGVGAERVQFVSRQPRSRYLQLYHQIDLCLETFPYNGHTTSLDALWMGVPTPTRIGSTAVGRGGFSQLSNLGLGELASESVEAYQQCVVALAADVARLSELRATLRHRLLRSPLCDAPRFARSMEGALRTMWQEWSSGRVHPQAMGRPQFSLDRLSRRSHSAELRQAS